jgi:TetR/AcrR family transcriptional regulator, cholesterol catabolism regulator
LYEPLNLRPGQPLGRRERKKLDAKRRIGRAAADLFRERGYEKTTVEEIAERADVAKGTIFNHYPSKEALLEVVAEEMFEEVQAALGPLEDWGDTSRELIRRLFLEMARVAENNRALFRVLLFERLKGMYDCAAEDALPPPALMLRRIVALAQDRGEIREDVEVEQVATVLEAALLASLLVWLGRKQPHTGLQDDLSAKLDLVFLGLLPAGRGRGDDTDRTGR